MPKKGFTLGVGAMIGTVVTLVISSIFFAGSQVGRIIGIVAVGGLLMKAVGGKGGLGALIGALITISLIRELFGGAPAPRTAPTTGAIVAFPSLSLPQMGLGVPSATGFLGVPSPF